MILHSGDVPGAAYLSLEQRCLNAGGACHFQDLIVCDVASPVDAEDGAEAALMETLKEANVPKYVIQVSAPHSSLVSTTAR